MVRITIDSEDDRNNISNSYIPFEEIAKTNKFNLTEKRKINQIKDCITRNRKRINLYKNQLKIKKTVRIVKRIFNSNTVKTTAEIIYLNNKIKQVKKNNSLLKTEIMKAKGNLFLRNHQTIG